LSLTALTLYEQSADQRQTELIFLSDLD